MGVEGTHCDECQAGMTKDRELSSLEAELEQMFVREMSFRGRAFVHYEALGKVQTKHCACDGLDAEIRFNPERVRSVMAEVDAESLQKRACFLCPTGLEENQLTTDWYSPLRGDKVGHYCIRVNPFPIFERHYTLSSAQHEKQAILPHLSDLFLLCAAMPHYSLFYNGPYCGASAPDHFHFQAVPYGSLPLQRMCDRGEGLSLLSTKREVRTYMICHYAKSAYLIQSKYKERAEEQFMALYTHLQSPEREEWEPRMNVVGWWNSRTEEYNIIMLLRQESRPQCFFASGEEQLLLSPASVEMAGIAIVADEKSYTRLTGERLQKIIAEVSLSPQETQSMESTIRQQQAPLHVGIVSNKDIRFRLDGAYLFEQEGNVYTGEQIACIENGKVRFGGKLYDSIRFVRHEASSSFWLYDVVIGVHFHWERKEAQHFAGDLHIIVEENQLTAINIIGVEDYLQSVISSEMSASSHIELLKAHAVISRSWVLRPLYHPSASSSACVEDTEGRHIRWYERDAHKHFDVCADDHCQRYQGITRQTSKSVEEAVKATWGEVLTYEGKICDARFYKSCGGATERFEHCWAAESHPYLRPILDAKDGILPDLTQEQEAEKWILTSPKAFCNTTDKTILSQVLNGYDQETEDFYRWQVHYSQEELSVLVREKSGIDFGTIEDLIPKKRGESGRIYELEIVGSKQHLTIGKELEIRKWLSASHLYSSAFVVRKEQDSSQKTVGFTLYGAGWGHGVGLCQIGAAVMATQGYSYKEILSHYFPGASLSIVHK